MRFYLLLFLSVILTPGIRATGLSCVSENCRCSDYGVEIPAQNRTSACMYLPESSSHDLRRCKKPYHRHPYTIPQPHNQPDTDAAGNTSAPTLYPIIFLRPARPPDDGGNPGGGELPLAGWTGVGNPAYVTGSQFAVRGQILSHTRLLYHLHRHTPRKIRSHPT